jgi:hypothetical protein
LNVTGGLGGRCIEEEDGTGGITEVVCCPAKLPEAELVCCCSCEGEAGIIEAQGSGGEESKGREGKERKGKP